MLRKPAIPTTPAEPVYDDWMDYSMRRDLARADALRARQIAEAEAQDAAALAPPPVFGLVDTLCRDLHPAVLGPRHHPDRPPVLISPPRATAHTQGAYP